MEQLESAQMDDCDDNVCQRQVDSMPDVVSVMDCYLNLALLFAPHPASISLIRFQPVFSFSSLSCHSPVLLVFNLGRNKIPITDPKDS